MTITTTSVCSELSFLLFSFIFVISFDPQYLPEGRAGRPLDSHWHQWKPGLKRRGPAQGDTQWVRDITLIRAQWPCVLAWSSSPAPVSYGAPPDPSSSPWLPGSQAKGQAGFKRPIHVFQIPFEAERMPAPMGLQCGSAGWTPESWATSGQPL